MVNSSLHHLLKHMETLYSRLIHIKKEGRCLNRGWFSYTSCYRYSKNKCIMCCSWKWSTSNSLKITDILVVKGQMIISIWISLNIHNLIALAEHSSYWISLNKLISRLDQGFPCFLSASSLYTVNNSLCKNNKTSRWTLSYYFCFIWYSCQELTHVWTCSIRFYFAPQINVFLCCYVWIKLQKLQHVEDVLLIVSIVLKAQRNTCICFKARYIKKCTPTCKIAYVGFNLFWNQNLWPCLSCQVSF